MKRLLKTAGLTATALLAGLVIAGIHAWVRGVPAEFISATQSSTAVLIGQPVTLSLRFRLPWNCDNAQIQPRFIPKSDALILVKHEWRLVDWGIGYAYWDLVCTLKGMDQAETGGAITVNLPGTTAVSVGLEPIVVTTNTPVTQNSTIRLAAQAQPVHVPASGVTLSIVIGIVSALLIGAVLWAISGSEQKPPLSAAATAMASLHKLAVEPPKDPEAYYQLLTDIVRTYMAATWQVPAPTQTTRELLMTLEADETIVPLPLRELIREFLLRSDVVKYGGARTDADGMQYSREIAERLVRESEEAMKIGARR